ncbi:MAG: hypothetical protein M1820_004221 [Bogoriella megaspora]|nr:MAG: hypothetical protein M1820_004221 [Bogoriella megaspora]
MPLPVRSTGVTITNPLVLYRALLSTRQIDPDPAQHRLAVHLQKLYEQLKDYEPEAEYSERLNQVNQSVNRSDGSSVQSNSSIGTRGVWQSLLSQKEKKDSLALTRVLTDHEAAMNLKSPKGLMLHGEVGTGKSMLIDLFADCLPSKKKRRWHFNTFMLETFARLEQLRQERSSKPPSPSYGPSQDDYSLLWLARSLIRTSPILFLDEFQLPDRAASKIMSNLLTSFFQLGGVLIATSNRMPEELAKAAGIEFTPPPTRMESIAWRLGLGGGDSKIGRSGNMFAGKEEFTEFLEVLKARCDVWEMGGGKDYRRSEAEAAQAHQQQDVSDLGQKSILTSASANESSPGGTTRVENLSKDNTKAPAMFLIHPISSPASSTTLPDSLENALHVSLSLSSDSSIFWTPTHIKVYNRLVPIPRSYSGITWWTFGELCGTSLGPADYITLASSFHTLVLTKVPVLTTLQKNEARRFITLLDALYEARCKILISAAAGPDEIFFPETQRSDKEADEGIQGAEADAIYPETFAEAYQDATAPFRPNVSSYASSRLPVDALEDDPPNRLRRAGTSSAEGDAYDTRRLGTEVKKQLDFASTGSFTGEDERFAYRRARSRLWEMCGRKWWNRAGPPEEWWKPLDRKLRPWEGRSEEIREEDRKVNEALAKNATSDSYGAMMRDPVGSVAEDVINDRGRDMMNNHENKEEATVFRHGASPFRKSMEPPPKFSWTHIWGTMKWGRKAGAWGKGVDGLKERRREKERNSKNEIKDAGKE